VVDRLAAMLFFAVLARPVEALELEQVNASYAEEQYRCELVATLAAPAEQVAAVLRDYEAYPQLDERIRMARVLSRESQHVWLETKVRACAGVFCRTVRRVERVEENASTLVATADPARSDVEFGETRTQWEALDAEHTRVVYRTHLQPSVWIPSLFGRSWALNTMRDATVDLFERVEAAAQARAVAVATATPAE